MVTDIRDCLERERDMLDVGDIRMENSDLNEKYRLVGSLGTVDIVFTFCGPNGRSRP